MVRRLAAGSALAFATASAPAVTIVFEEDFEGLPLGPPVDEGFLTPLFPEAFTHTPPPGWFNDRSDVPGVNTPSIGVEEWEGWSFANADFWVAAAAGPTGGPSGGREDFAFGDGTIAVADPDQWNDRGNPANNLGFYNTLLRTPQIDLSTRGFNEDRLVLQFDSSWRGGCCDDGGQFDPGGNNQTATIYARVGDTFRAPVLRWESAPFFDEAGRPTQQPTDPSGSPNTPNEFFRPDNFNERVWIDLSDIALPPQGSPDFALLTAATASSGLPLSLEFEMSNAGDDGFWGIDNVQLASFTTLLGDMDLSGVVDTDDIDDFAEGMLDTSAYRLSHFGEFPVTRGSVDSTFDFDDAPWFVGLFAAPAEASALLTAALQPLPEPSSAFLATLGVGAIAVGRGRRR